MMSTRRKSERGVALVVTVIVVAMLAVVAVAMMQSTTVDRLSSRSVANYYRAQLAAQSGLAAAMSTISLAITNGRSGAAQWNYVSGHLNVGPQGASAPKNAEANAFAFIAQVDPSTGKLLPNLSYLTSTSQDIASAFVPISSEESEPAYPAQWVTVYATNSSGDSNAIARYAFWVSDDTTKLNPQVMGSKTTREFSSDPSNIRMTVRGSAASRNSNTVIPPSVIAPFLSSTVTPGLSHWDGSQSRRRAASGFLTPGTFKLAIGDSLAPAQSLENDAAMQTLSAPVAPNGKPKINLARLKAFLDSSSLPKSQAAGNRRFQAVSDILQSSKTDAHKQWGGGDLSFLVDSKIMGGKYTQKEAEQFVANLFDALDEDFIPTCDNDQAPTVLGTEIRQTANGLQGHPYIVYAGSGHFAGRFNAQSQTSRLRTHLALGFANPWSAASESWAKYALDFTLTPSDGQFPTLMSENAEQINAKPSSLPGADLPSRSGYLFPCGSAQAPHYSALRDLPGRLQQITKLTFTLNKARLIYKSTEGDFLVAMVPGSPVLDALPDTVPAGGDGQNRLAWESGRQAYWLSSDPRLHPNLSSWTKLPNGAGGANTGIIPGPQAAITYMKSQDDGDGAQGLTGTITPGMTSASDGQWYRSASIKNHLSMDASLVFEGNKTRIDSSGLLGFLNVGKPWRTLTLHKGNANNPVGQEDWKIFDYVYTGAEVAAGNAVLHANMSQGAPYGPGGARADFPGAFSRDGSLNSLHGNWNTWRGLLEEIPGINADLLASQLAVANSQPYANTFEFLRSVDLGAGGTTDFERERAVRYLADALSNRSRSFTAYAIGEALAPTPAGQPPKVVSRAVAKGRLLIDLDETSGGVAVRLLQSNIY